MTLTRPTRAPNLRARYRVLAESGFVCDYCGASAKRDGVRLEVDHVVAQAAGGTHDRANLVAACRSCNQGKSDRPVPFPRFERVTDRWDRCECEGGPASVAIEPHTAILLCEACHFPAYRRVFPVSR